MRRIVLAAFAVLLLHAAPSMAAECRNLALAGYGGTASVSSYTAGWNPSALNNGRREDIANGTYHWIDDTRWSYPDWAQVEWRSAVAIDRIVVRGPVPTASTWWGFEVAAERTLARTRIQYYDGATSRWVDVVGRAGQDNPITDWVMPWQTAEGSEFRQFDFTAVTTTRIRALIEEGSANGYSHLDEIEAYESGSDCDPPPILTCRNVALDGTASASSVHASGLYPVAGVNNGRRESGTSQGYWNDGTNGSWPDWVQIAWATPQTIDRVVARIPLAQSGFPLGEITLERTRIQYFDDATSTWVDIAGRSGQDNPILDWQGPVDVYDGSESRSFDVRPVTTTKIRALIEDGSTDGWSWLDELEAYNSDCAEPTPRDVNVAGTGAATASTTWNSSASTIIDGRRQVDRYAGYWIDDSSYVDGDWVQVAWAAPQSINRIVLRAPWQQTSYAPTYRTLARTRVQYWADEIPKWVDVNSTQPNPIIDWVVPEDALDGSEIKQFDFPTVSTSRVRILSERGNAFGRTMLDELEAYWVS